jgi:hypothetical protein
MGMSLVLGSSFLGYNFNALPWFCLFSFFGRLYARFHVAGTIQGGTG